MLTPILIEEQKKIISIKVLAEDYYNLEVRYNDEITQKAIFIQKKLSKQIDLSKYKSNIIYHLLLLILNFIIYNLNLLFFY